MSIVAEGMSESASKRRGGSSVIAESRLCRRARGARAPKYAARDTVSRLRDAGRSFGRVSLLAACCAAFVLSANPAPAAEEPSTAGGEALIRRLSPEQYRLIIADVFGPGLQIGGRFEPETRVDGLMAVGNGKVSVTASGLEQYDTIARSIASQIVDERHRGTYVPCKPAKDADADDICTSNFISSVGELLYRRPLTKEELLSRVKVAADTAKAKKNFYAGLATSLADILVSPQFLFRQEEAEADPSHSGQYRLDALSKASQLSFLFWNTSPDPRLLAAAKSGELNTSKGLTKQVDRLLASPARLAEGARAFFADMLGFDEFSTLSKDGAIYPRFTSQVAKDAPEQTLRTIVDHLVVRKGDYRDLFTTRRTFLTRPLGAIYGVPVVKSTPNDTQDDWVAYEFPEGDPRGVGILGQVSFVALHSHPGRSSPTLRGKALRQILLCQKVPDPPGNVNFTVVQDTNNPQFRTTRDRVTAHRTDPTCAGCHKLVDPMGLALENFDGSGAYRTTENGAAIDSSGELDGIKFGDATGLGKAMHDHPAATACFVNRLYAYALGRPPAKGEQEFTKYLEKSFAANGYRYADLLRTIATSDAFYRVSSPQTGALDLSTSKRATSNALVSGDR